MIDDSDYMTRDEWLAKCKELAGDNWDYYNDEYGFIHAHRDGLTPEQAIEDCKNWLKG